MSEDDCEVVFRHRTPQEQIEYLLAEVALLSARVGKLERQRRGRPRKQILISAEGVCGLDFTQDSATCPNASLHYRRQGCQGTACQQKATEYYQNYRKRGESDAEGEDAQGPR